MIPGCASPVYQLTVILQPPIFPSSLLCRHLFAVCCYSQIMGVKVSGSLPLAFSCALNRNKHSGQGSTPLDSLYNGLLKRKLKASLA